MFGKHKGKKVSQVPKGYIEWAKRELGIKTETNAKVDPEAILRTQELAKDGEWVCPKCNYKNYLTDTCRACRKRIDIKSPLVKGNSQPDENGNIYELRGYYEIKAHMEANKREREEEDFATVSRSGNRGAGKSTEQIREAIRRVLRNEI